MLVGDSFPAASATINIVTSGAGIQANDRVTLWYENLAWDFVASGPVDPSYVAQQLASQINSTDWVNKAGPPYAILAATNGAQISVTAARYGAVNVDGASVTFAGGSYFSGILPGAPILIGGAAYTVAGIQSPSQLTLTSPAPQASGVPYVAPLGGRDGNMIQIYALSQTSTLATDQPQYQFTGGSSAVTWNVTLDFTGLKIDSLRQCWLTFAPSLAYGAAYAATEWQAVFSNWTLSGNEDVKKLQIAGPGSVRIEENDTACKYTGTWTLSDNTEAFYSRYFAMATVDPSATVTVTYTCQLPHDLYCGTSVYSDRAVMSVQVDGDTATPLDCTLDASAAVVTRRLMRKAVPAGSHTVTLSMQTPGAFYFDFLEAAVASDLPDALAPRIGISPALDFDTDHSYKLPPARIHWIMDKLGYAGPMNEYLGVFWWNQRKLVGATFPSAVISVGGSWAAGDVALLTVNGVTLQKDVFPADTPATIAQHFAAYINEAFVAAWASVAASDSGITLTITASSTAGAYALAVSTSVTSAAGTFTVSQSPVAAAPGNWVIDDTVTPPINRATRDWHADFYALAAARSREVVTSCSMELVNPPAGYAALFPDAQRTPVATATGFGTLISNHCAIGGSKMLAYQKALYRDIAGLQTAAGLTPALQYGEFLWWYFSFAQGLPVGYASYTAPISIGTANPHGLSTGNVVSISGVLGNTAANGVWTISVTDPTHFTLNNSSGNGNYTGGGSIFGGGMAYYDDETLAAAQTALGRALHVFQLPNDDPSVNSSADAVFLRNRLRDHVAALVADIRSAYPGVICEVLWPYDVNYPSPVGTPPVGGRLNRFINLPVEWQTKPQSGLDRIKAEALAFGTSLRNLDYASDAINLFPSLGWPVSAVRYLVPIFGTAVPWYKELNLAIGAGLNTNNLWAFDHICLYNLQVPEPPPPSRSVVQT